MAGSILPPCAKEEWKTCVGCGNRTRVSKHHKPILYPFYHGLSGDQLLINIVVLVRFSSWWTSRTRSWTRCCLTTSWTSTRAGASWRLRRSRRRRRRSRRWRRRRRPRSRTGSGKRPEKTSNWSLAISSESSLLTPDRSFLKTTNLSGAIW